jgi:hypothetical protein
MQRRIVFGILTLALLASPAVSQAQNMGRMNPMVTLMEQGLPVLGMTHPAITAGRGGGAGRGGAAADPNAAAVAPPPAPVLSEVARETMAYSLADFEYNSYSPANAERFAEYMRELIKAGGTAKAHPFISKIPIVHGDPASAQARIIEQMNAGHVGVFMQQVETVEEVQQAIAAMRFRSRGGIRPDEGVGLAAALWGLTEEQYRDKADVWPINPNG